MDTRVALGGDGGGRYDTPGGGETVSRPELADDLQTGVQVCLPTSAGRMMKGVTGFGSNCAQT